MKSNHIELARLIAPAKLRRARNGNLPVLSITMRDGLIDQVNKFKKRVASADTSQYKIVGRNQLVVGFPIDEGVLAFQNLYDEAIVSPAYDVWDLQDPSAISSYYLERFLRSPFALTFYAAKLRGTTARRRTLPDDVFLSLRVPLPPVAEQERIAAILDKVDAVRAKRRAALVELDSLTQSIFLDLFGDPAINPKGWPRRSITEIGKVITGNTPPRTNASYYGTEIEWIKSDNINTPHYFITKAEEGLSAAGRTVARTAPAGSILVTCIAGSRQCIGNAAMTDREVTFNQQINAFIPLHGNAHFFYAQIIVAKRLIQEASTTGMKAIVSKGRFEQIRLIFPPPELQNEFARRVAAVEKLKAPHHASLAEMDALFASLQHRAFRGQL